MVNTQTSIYQRKIFTFTLDKSAAQGLEAEEVVKDYEAKVIKDFNFSLTFKEEDKNKGEQMI